MTLAWIDENGTVRCCSDMCDGCDKREEHGCVPVTVIRGNVRDLRERVSDLIGSARMVEDGLWTLHNILVEPKALPLGTGSGHTHGFF